MHFGIRYVSAVQRKIKSKIAYALEVPTFLAWQIGPGMGCSQIFNRAIHDKRPEVHKDPIFTQYEQSAAEVESSLPITYQIL